MTHLRGITHTYTDTDRIMDQRNILTHSPTIILFVSVVLVPISPRYDERRRRGLHYIKRLIICQYIKGSSGRGRWKNFEENLKKTFY
jgi:hypothetical protein